MQQQINELREEMKNNLDGEKRLVLEKMETQLQGIVEKFDENIAKMKTIKTEPVDQGYEAPKKTVNRRNRDETSEDSDSDSGESVKIKIPEFKVGEDAEGFLIKFEIACKGNKWKCKKRCRVFPSCLQTGQLSWYTALDKRVQKDYTLLAAAFLHRFNVHKPIYEVKLEYHELRARQFDSLEEYASKLQDLGQKLGASKSENLDTFLMISFRSHCIYARLLNLDCFCWTILF